MSDAVIQGADAPPIPPPLESPEPVVKTYAEELEAAAADLAPAKPRNGIKMKEKAAKEPDEPAPEAAKPEPAKEPVTQEKLSSGFAKLARQQRAAEKKEKELTAREAEIAKQREEFDRTHGERTTALETRSQDLEKLLKLFDEDEEACLEALATRRKTTVEAFYDKLTRRRLNGGVRAPEDQVAEVRAEVDALKKEKAEKEAEAAAAAEKAKKEQELQAAQKAFEQRIAHENAGFVSFCKSKNETDAIRYPLLSEETDEDIVSVARNLIAGATAQGKNVSYNEVADYMEHLLSLHKLKEDAAAKAAEAETPKKSAPKPEGKKAEPAKAKTLTNQASAPRILKAESTPANDEERMNRALSIWK